MHRGKRARVARELLARLVEVVLVKVQIAKSVDEIGGAQLADLRRQREFAADARRRWVRRLAEMAWIFGATERPEHEAMARSAAAALAAPDAEARRHPFVRTLAQRGLEVASEVAAGRLRAADVSRRP